MEKINTALVKTAVSKENFSAEDEANLQLAAAKIKSGELVAFPTETVYGLGGNGLDEDAARKIYAAKGRPSDNPLILHFSDLAMVKKLFGTLPAMAEKLLTAYAPGPITVIVPKTPEIPYTVTGGLETVAIRIPDNDITRELIHLAQVPIAGPSANTSGRPSPTTGQMVYDDLKGRIQMILDGGCCQVGLESTIVDCTGEYPVILRPGAITPEMLQELFPVVKLDAALEDASARPKAPGMKYKHYAPKAPMTLLLGSIEDLKKYFAAEIADFKQTETKLGLFISRELRESLGDAVNSPAVVLYDYGSVKDYSAIATKIYYGLRFFDHQKVGRILGQGIAETGLGLAIMNRLKKAAAGNVVKL